MSEHAGAPRDPSAVIDSFLRARSDDGSLTVLGSGGGAWDVLLPSDWKESVAVSLHLGDWTLRAEAFFMRGPDENRAEAYHLLLQRNRRSGMWRFAANEAGDVSLQATLPRPAVTPDELDRLLGELVTLTDETYVPYLKTAFATALEEQVRRGGPGVDRPPPWAR